MVENPGLSLHCWTNLLKEAALNRTLTRSHSQSQLQSEASTRKKSDDIHRTTTG